MQQPGMSSFSVLENLYHAQNNGVGIPAQQTAVISCPKKMVGRVIGKNGETIKALQQYTGAQIQIDQRCDPTRVSIAGPLKSLQVATSMVQDIVAGTFKGFAMLRSFASQTLKAPEALGFVTQPVPVYIEGYGFVPPSQFYDPSETAAPVYQQNLHGFHTDPVSVLRAISPSNTSGSGGASASPQAVPATNSSNANTLTAALAQAQLFNFHAASPLSDLPTTSPSFNQSPQAQGLSHLQQGVFAKPFISQPINVTARSLFAAGNDQQSMKMSENILQSTAPLHLPPLSSSSSLTAVAQPTPLSVWSQLEKLSPNGAATNGSPLLTPAETPSSRASSPAAILSKQSSGNAGHQVAADSAALVSRLQALSLLSRQKPAASSFQQPAANPTYSTSVGLRTTPADALPNGWIQMLDPENRQFYHNCFTGKSQYHTPTGETGTSAAILHPHLEEQTKQATLLQ